MAERTKPVSLRDTELSSTVDIARRLAFLACILGGVGGMILIIAGLVLNKIPVGIIGLNLLIICGLIFTLRHRLGLSNVKAELEKNPFKPTRVPNE